MYAFVFSGQACKLQVEMNLAELGGGLLWVSASFPVFGSTRVMTEDAAVVTVGVRAMVSYVR
jgi:hypothetical protein